MKITWEWIALAFLVAGVLHYNSADVASLSIEFRVPPEPSQQRQMLTDALTLGVPTK